MAIIIPAKSNGKTVTSFSEFKEMFGIGDTIKLADDKILEYGNTSRRHRSIDNILGWLLVGLGAGTAIIGLVSGLPAWIAGGIGVATSVAGLVSTKGNFKDWKLFARGERKLRKEKADYYLPGGDYVGKTPAEKDQLFQERVYSLIETVEGS